MRHEINNLIKKSLLKRDEEMTIFNFDEEVYVEHEDGSKFEFKHAKHERQKLKNLDIIVVFNEHNTVNVFVDVDLVKVKIKPRKGRTYSLKLQKFKAKTLK